MSVYGLLSFCAAYVLAVASPGPGVAVVLARSLGHGMRGASAFIAGFLIGDLVWFAVAAAGLAALAQVAQTAFVVVKYAGVVYLLYLAYRLWTSPAKPLGNPKTMLFFVALLPIVVPLETLGALDYVEVAVAIAVILPTVLCAYAVAATQARQFFRSERSVRILNRCAGTAMASAAVAIAARDA